MCLIKGIKNSKCWKFLINTCKDINTTKRWMNQGKFIQCFLSYENSDCQEDDKNLLKKIGDIINHANKIGQI